MFEPIQILNETQVNYIVIGTWAMKLNDKPCLPRDIDVWLDNSSLSTSKLIEEYFYRLTNKKISLLSNDFCIVFKYGLTKYNFLSKAEGLLFIDSFKSALKRTVDDIDITFLCQKDIITNKMSTGRINDNIDIIKIKKYGKSFN